jgi:CheY-like chemotaxis protein
VNREPSITVVEYDPMLSMLLLEVLAEQGYQTELWTERAGAFEFVRRTQPDLVILDVWLQQRGDGWQVFDRLQRDPVTRRIPTILCTDGAHLLQMEAADVVERAAAVLEKPFEIDHLLTLVSETLEAKARAPERLVPHAERRRLPMEAMGQPSVQ